jgi:hypothetical protein
MGIKMDQQEAIRRLQELAIELGRTPAWNEINKAVSKHHIYNLFGNNKHYQN